MKKILIILLLLFIALVISVYMVYSYRTELLESQKISKQYEQYYNMEMLGTELISLINKTIDINTKNGIVRDKNKNYIYNNENSIHIYIKFVYKDKTKTIQMEDIEKMGTEAFVRIYSTASFKCTEITYHEKTNHVKSLTFEEIAEFN